MNFKTIELTNIGPYKDKNTFNFSTDENKNTVLIGGNNGSGKTTFLNSVRLALYGPLAYGFRTHTQTYLSIIETLLNNNATEEKDKPFIIKLGFSTVEDFKRVYVEIIRSWTYSNSIIKEHIEIHKNNIKLNEIDKDNFLEKLRVSFPPSLLELCFFDGEDITNLSSDDNLSTYLKELSSKLFNLDLFQSLESNLKKYLSEDSKSSYELELENEKKATELDLNIKVSKLKKIEQETEALTEQLMVTREIYQNTRKEFSTHGGLLYEQRQKIQREILEIESNRKVANESIKDFVAKEIPFFLALPVLNNLVDQLNLEEDYYISTIIDEKLSKISTQRIKEKLDFHLDSEKLIALRELLKTELSTTNNVSIMHNASKTETNQIHALAASTTQDRLDHIINLMDENSEDLKRLYLLNKSMRDNVQTSEFTDMIEIMESKSKEISELEVQLNDLIEHKEEISIDIENINKQYEKISKDLYTMYKKKSSFHITEKALTISQKFQQDQLRKKVRDVEYFSTKMIKKLMRKENFIHRIKINFNTFEINLVDQDHRNINKNILSAGEKELLVLSIIWGTIHSSNKDIPVVLDTLLGRLDLEHKATVVNELIPRFGKQCIILATNSEITVDLVEDLSAYVANYYTLDYDTNKKHTNIEKHFFKIEGEHIHEF